MTIETYRGWTIQADYVGYSATHDNYEAWTEGEGEWADNGLRAFGRTLVEVRAEIDCRIGDGVQSRKLMVLPNTN